MTRIDIPLLPSRRAALPVEPETPSTRGPRIAFANMTGDCST